MTTKKISLEINGKKHIVDKIWWMYIDDKNLYKYQYQIDDNYLLCAFSLGEMISKIINHKNDFGGAKNWYGQGRYMGD